MNELTRTLPPTAGYRLAQTLTFLRFVLAFLFVALFVWDFPGTRVLLLVIAVAMEASDIFDGAVARRDGKASHDGAILDTMADNFARGAEFICLLSKGMVPVWLVVAVFWRDSLVALVRLLSLARGERYRGTRGSGKVKGISQAVCLISVLMSYAFQISDVRWVTFANTMIGLAFFFTVFSAVDYLMASRRSAPSSSIDYNSPVVPSGR